MSTTPLQPSSLMIKAKTVTCSVCQSYYSDPRQIPCSHSFCFDCISGRFDEESLTLVCPECQRSHQYKSLEEFNSRCMRNTVLATIVTQFKKNQSRASNASSASFSRPSSTVGHLSSPTFASTPIPTPFSSAQQASFATTSNGFHLDQSMSERSSPAMLSGPGRPSPVAPAFVAKCQVCGVKAELAPCTHCDNVICGKCALEHQQQNKISVAVQKEWELCKAKFEGMNEKSMRYENDREEMKTQARGLQKSIREKADEMIQSIKQQRETFFQVIDQHRQGQKPSSVQEEVIDEYESIDKRVNEWLQTNEINTEQINEFLFEIRNLETRLDELNTFVHSHEAKFPNLSAPKEVDAASLLGSLDFVVSSSTSPIDRANPYASTSQVDEPAKSTNHRAHPHDHSLHELQSDEDEQETELAAQPARCYTRPAHVNCWQKGPSPLKAESNTSSSPPPPPSSTSTTTTTTIPKKRLLWSIDYFSVPYYVRTYGNQLFVCDRYGSLAIYRFQKANEMYKKPERVIQMKLFKDNASSSSSNSDEDQTIIDSFVVYKLWIVVFKRKKNELIGTIHLFTHDGKPVPNGKCPHNYPSRELTMDTEKNVLWSLDQKQLTLFCYDLPESRVNNPNDYFQHRQAHVQLSKPFAPIHISVNRHVLAVLDKNRGAVHVFDKETKRQSYEYLNVHHRDTHGCWDMALFSDSSLLIKLDETSTLKAGPSKHIYLQLDNTAQHHVIGMIDETDAYGMMITPHDEILIGVRISTKGIVKCYV